MPRRQLAQVNCSRHDHEQGDMWDARQVLLKLQLMFMHKLTVALQIKGNQ